MSRTTHTGVAPRAIAVLVATTFATAGAWSLAAGTASATPGDPHKVWVCKYVKKPGEDETLKRGKNPIHVDSASLTNDSGVEPEVGDSFSDGQFRSLVVSLEEEPTADCPAPVEPTPVQSSAPAPAPTTQPAPAPQTPSPTTPQVTTAAPALPLPQPPTGNPAPAPQATAVLAPVPALGNGAPDTGGLGRPVEESGSADLLVGLGLLGAAGALAGTAIVRRRRAAAVVEVD